MRYTMIGFFTCGCNYEASEVVDIVECETLDEVNEIKRLMKEHAASYQCNFQGVKDIMVFPSTTMDKRKITSFKEYIKLWTNRDKDGKEIAEELIRRERKK